MYKLKLVSHYQQRLKDETVVPGFIYVISGSPEALAEYRAIKKEDLRNYGINPETDEAYLPDEKYYVPKDDPNYGKPMYFTIFPLSYDEDEVVQCTMAVKEKNVYFNKVTTTQDILTQLAADRKREKDMRMALKLGIGILG